MGKICLFDGISEGELKKIFKCFSTQVIHYKKDTTVISNMVKNNLMGVIIKGKACLVKYDLNGERTILENIYEGDFFGGMFQTDSFNELVVVTAEESDIVLFDFDYVTKKCSKNCLCHTMLINNMIGSMVQNMKRQNERIDILTKKTTRDKLLEYFDTEAKKKGAKVFVMPMSYTDLADYFGVDRSALMREIKYLKDDGLIETNKKKITLLY